MVVSFFLEYLLNDFITIMGLFLDFERNDEGISSTTMWVFSFACAYENYIKSSYHYKYYISDIMS